MKRLEAAASLIEKTGTFADIGCDHGKLSLFVLKNGLADKVYAADISKGSLLKAEKLLSGFENARCIISDGFKSLPEDIDTAAICGIGGRNIIEIIGYRLVKTLILQPQKNLAEVKAELIRLGYTVTKEIQAAERGRHYTAVRAELKTGEPE